MITSIVIWIILFILFEVAGDILLFPLNSITATDAEMTDKLLEWIPNANTLYYTVIFICIIFLSFGIFLPIFLLWTRKDPLLHFLVLLEREYKNKKLTFIWTERVSINTIINILYNLKQKNVAPKENYKAKYINCDKKCILYQQLLKKQLAEIQPKAFPKIQCQEVPPCDRTQPSFQACEAWRKILQRNCVCFPPHSTGIRLSNATPVIKTEANKFITILLVIIFILILYFISIFILTFFTLIR